jgi:hypothetical protein
MTIRAKWLVIDPFKEIGPDREKWEFGKVALVRLWLVWNSILKFVVDKKLKSLELVVGCRIY